jgi:hypothetical protein
MVPTGGFGRTAAAEAEAAAPAEPAKKPAASILGKGRGPKRHRRAL